MSWIKDGIKVLGINLGVTLFLLKLLIIIPALWGDVPSAFKEYVEKPSQKKSSRANLSNYENEPWAAMHFFEFEKSPIRFHIQCRSPEIQVGKSLLNRPFHSSVD